MKHSRAEIDAFALRADAMRYFLAVGRSDLAAEAGAVSGPAALMMQLLHMTENMSAAIDALVQSVQRAVSRRKT
jgi:hypothetical protein